MKEIVFATTEGSIHNPASSGERPSTSWRCWVMNSMIEPISMVPNIMPPNAVLKTPVESLSNPIATPWWPDAVAR